MNRPAADVCVSIRRTSKPASAMRRKPRSLHQVFLLLDWHAQTFPGRLAVTIRRSLCEKDHLFVWRWQPPIVFKCRIHLAGGTVVVVVVVVVDVELVGSLGLLGLAPVASLARALV